MPDLGYDWTVRPGRDDLPPVAQGHSAKKATARLIVEMILIGEPIAERGQMAGPRGQVWECRLDSGDGEGDLSGCGLPRWEPEWRSRATN